MTDSKNLTELSQAQVKLLESVYKGTCIHYESAYICKLAETYKTNANDIKSAPLLTQDSTAKNDYLETKIYNRLLEKEKKRQRNIDSITSIAFLNLEKEKNVANVANVADEPVDEDWLIQFFNIAQDITNEQMQIVWATILSEKIKKARSFSLKTLNSLKTLSAEEIQLFKRVSQFRLYNGGIDFLMQDLNFTYEKILFSDLQELQECGIISSFDSHIDVTLPFISENNFLYHNTNLVVCGKSSQDDYTFRIPIFTFTNFGKQLLDLLTPQQDNEYILHVTRILMDKHPQLIISAHKITDIVEDKVSFTKTNLLENTFSETLSSMQAPLPLKQ